MNNNKLNWWCSAERYDPYSRTEYKFVIYPNLRVVISANNKILYDKRHISLSFAMSTCQEWFDKRLANENS